MCLPAGARVGSNELGWTSSTNGRSATPPAADRVLGGGDLLQRAAEVHGARRGAVRGAVHGIGPSSAQSSLKTPGP